MRILYVNPGLHRHGGAERCLLGLLDALTGLDRADLEVRVAVFGEGDLAGLLRERGHGVVVVPLHDAFRPTARYRGAVGVVWTAVAATPAVPRAIHRLRSEIRRFGADIVHTNGTRAHAIAPLLRGTGAATVATLHDSPVSEIERRIMARCLRSFDAVIANSPLVARRFEPGVACRVVDNPVVAPVERDRAEARRRFALPDDAFVVASLSHFHWYKGQADLVAAMDRLDDRAHLLLAGGTLYGQPSRSYLDQLREAAAVSRAGARIHFTGVQDDVSWLYAAADSVAHCSVKPEPFGMAIVEALLTGTPVVSSTAGTPGEMLEHDRTALLYEPGDVPGLARHLAALARDQAVGERLGRDGQAWARERFAPERHARTVLGVYEELLAGGRRPAWSRGSCS